MPEVFVFLSCAVNHMRKSVLFHLFLEMSLVTCCFISTQSSLQRQALLNSELEKSNHSAQYGVNQFSYLSQKQFKGEYIM